MSKPTLTEDRITHRKANYVLRVQPVRLGEIGRFQVRIGIPGDSSLDFVPVYRTAYAEFFHVEVAHRDRSAAEREAMMLGELLGCPVAA